MKIIVFHAIMRKQLMLPKWYSVLKPMMVRFRRERARRIAERYPEIGAMKVVDLGGSVHFWEAVEDILNPGELTILNIAKDATSAAAGRSADGVILYDGKHIPFGNEEIDLLICNSVIEHVPLDQRQGLAREIGRVAKHYVIQTPAFEFPLEPHFAAPFLHWLPRAIGRSLCRATPYAVFAKGLSPADFFDEIHLLTRSEFARLFPGELLTERFAWMPKSYLICR